MENSITYNGPNSRFTRIAERMREVGLQTLAKVSHTHRELARATTVTLFTVLHVHTEQRVDSSISDLVSKERSQF